MHIQSPDRHCTPVTTRFVEQSSASTWQHRDSTQRSAVDVRLPRNPLRNSPLEVAHSLPNCHSALSTPYPFLPALPTSTRPRRLSVLSLSIFPFHTSLVPTCLR